MDNRIFNVNGQGDLMLLDTLRLVFRQNRPLTASTCVAWKQVKTHGLILFWCLDESTKATQFPTPLTADECIAFVLAWLKSNEAKTVDQGGWDADADHDGSNEDGWRVYCEDWGHVADYWSAICAIKPVRLWFGK